MNVTIIADPIVAVPPVTYGGAERVIAALCDGLSRRGHRVVLVAKAGSRNYGTLVTHVPPDNTSFISRAHRKILFQAVSLAAARSADVVHNFGRVDYLWSILRTKQPLLHTFENPIVPYELDVLLRRPRRNVMLVSVSDHQRAAYDHRGNWRTIYNAVDVRMFPFSATPANPPYLAFLGRLTKNKGVHVAIEAARKAGVKLKIAGNVSKEAGGEAYFEQFVRPALGPDVEWIGEVNDAQKVEFLGNASALLFPIQWDEPCAVVLGETLASGTPIIALRRASVPEAVEDGKTGFLCANADEMAQAVARIGEIKREDCRLFAERNLSADVMVDDYLETYRELVSA